MAEKNKFGKDIVLYFFEKGEDFIEGTKTCNYFTCKCVELLGRECNSTKTKFKVIPVNGYSNLKTHLTTCIPNYEALYADRLLPVAVNDMRNYVKVDAKSFNTFKWIEWIVVDNLPFSFVEKKLTRENTNRDPISRGTIMKYLDSLGWETNLVLANLLPEKFAQAFDGWDDGNSRNYFGVFVIWWDEKRNCNRVYLLRICPLVRADDFGAASHLESISAFLLNVGKSIDNVSVFLGDNCATNIALAHLADKPFIGCYSHRLNLAVKAHLVNHEELLQKVNSLMILLSSKKNAGRLRRGGCKLKPVKLFLIKWSGIFNTVQRYLKLRPFLNVGFWVTFQPILERLPNPAEHNTLTEMFEDLKKFESVSKGLQEKNGNLKDARIGVNWLMEIFPDTAPKLSMDFCDDQNRDFESGVIKVQSNQEALLTADERYALIPFLKEHNGKFVLFLNVMHFTILCCLILIHYYFILDDPENIDLEIDAPVNDYQSALKKARRNQPQAVVGGTLYISLWFILAATNVVERLFSQTKLVYTDGRMSMTPAHLELVMFLKINRDLWDAHTVLKIRRNPRPRPGQPVLEAGALLNVEAGAHAIMLDDPEIGDYENAFINDEEDGDFWDDENIANFLGAIDLN